MQFKIAILPFYFRTDVGEWSVRNESLLYQSCYSRWPFICECKECFDFRLEFCPMVTLNNFNTFNHYKMKLFQEIEVRYSVETSFHCLFRNFVFVNIVEMVCHLQNDLWKIFFHAFHTLKRKPSLSLSQCHKNTTNIYPYCQPNREKAKKDKKKTY